MSLTPGATLGPYTITAELGRGGMGVVYTAHEPRLKRQVAIKILSPDLPRDVNAKQRFLEEQRQRLSSGTESMQLIATVRPALKRFDRLWESFRSH